jgi:tRNA G10  N-methylase Trm11
MLLFVLGRQPEIGLAELRAVFGKAELVLPQIALVSTEETPNIDRLGSVRKVGQIIYDDTGDPHDFLLDKLKELPSGKITLGISCYGSVASAASANKMAVSLKKQLNRSVRVLPNSEAEISDAAALGNKLGSSPNKIELLTVRVGRRLIVAELIGVQDINAYTLRDRGRPKRDARVGMLPPKLAQIMINLARGATTGGWTSSNVPRLAPNRETVVDEAKRGDNGLIGRMSSPTVLLDPFCGTGVVLQEAALMGFDTFGTDLEPRMIDFTKANLTWLQKTHRLDFGVKLEVGDATNYTWTLPIDLVATETYLGQPYSTAPPSEKLQHNITTCNTIISKFLTNLATQIASGTGLCIAVPCWFLNNKTYHLPLTHQLATFDYEQIFYTDSQKPLIYRRENQIVGRELLILRKKSAKMDGK